MAKMSMINREIKRQKLVKQFTSKRLELKKIVKNRDLPMEERFNAQIKLAKLPPNSSPSRLHNRCKVTGRPKAFYRKLQMSRIALRDYASRGEIPGMIKSSWWIGRIEWLWMIQLVIYLRELGTLKWGKEMK